ncbi:hypothetical protein [Wolbachia endosymbiont (group A) of Myopa testacea]|uniref:hypothetical protein n=1 Tax=Wolbachia endosymbiont (group A) of Myopa testacea TaxID=3066148 RepID=UPI003132ECA5
MHPDGVMKVADTGSLCNGVIQVADTGIQVAYKQISIESGYNVFDEIAGTSVSYSDDTILFSGSQCQLLSSATCKLQCSYSYVSRYLDDTVERNEPPFQNCFE